MTAALSSPRPRRNGCSASRIIGLLLVTCCGLTVPPPLAVSEIIHTQTCSNKDSSWLRSSPLSEPQRLGSGAHLQVPLIHKILRGGATRTMQWAAPSVKGSGIKPPRARHETSVTSDNKISADKVGTRSGGELLVGRDVEPQLGLRVKMSEASRQSRPFVQVKQESDGRIGRAACCIVSHLLELFVKIHADKLIPIASRQVASRDVKTFRSSHVIATCDSFVEKQTIMSYNKRTHQY
jgi:hypothetical protein